jgi:hypothetical protein
MDNSSPFTNGGANRVEVKNTPVRLNRTTTANPAKYGYDRHGGFFKWASNPLKDLWPKLNVHDSTFRRRPRRHGGNANGFLAFRPARATT